LQCAFALPSPQWYYHPWMQQKPRPSPPNPERPQPKTLSDEQKRLVAEIRVLQRGAAASYLRFRIRRSMGNVAIGLRSLRKRVSASLSRFTQNTKISREIDWKRKIKSRISSGNKSVNCLLSPWGEPAIIIDDNVTADWH